LVTFLGSGSYGEVWKGKEKSRKRDVAVKIETKIAS
jgi:serine/threonine protein kinase